jgi:sec-independent protein translocase protein TatB
MFDVGFSELLLVFVIGLLILGPERLPRVAAQVGRWVGRARRMANQLRYQLEREIAVEEFNRVQRPGSASGTAKAANPSNPSAESASSSTASSSTASAGTDSDGTRAQSAGPSPASDGHRSAPSQTIEAAPAPGSAASLPRQESAERADQKAGSI